MGFSLFKHNKIKCGGNLIMEITDMFSIKTPSLSITPEGIYVGVVELGLAGYKKPTFMFCCEKCGDTIKKEKFEEEIVVTCMICRMNKPLGEISTCNQISSICADCVQCLGADNTEPIPEHLKAISSWLRITADIKLKNYLDILKVPAQL